MVGYDARLCRRIADAQQGGLGNAVGLSNRQPDST
jgi:hypothetical protein